MKTKHILVIPLIALLGTACSGFGTGEKEETPQQIAAAANAGREAARKIVTRQFRDSMEFYGAILEANSGKSQYQMDSLKRCEAAYDSAFVSTIRTVRPDLADKLE